MITRRSPCNRWASLGLWRALLRRNGLEGRRDQGPPRDAAVRRPDRLISHEASCNAQAAKGLAAARGRLTG
jgi:hypothetical protein